MRNQQIDTIRLKLLKIAAKVIHSARYMIFKLCSNCPYKDEFYETPKKNPRTAATAGTKNLDRKKSSKFAFTGVLYPFRENLIAQASSKKAHKQNSELFAHE